MLDVLPQLVPTRLAGRSAAIAKPNRFALEPKIDDVRGLIVFRPDRVVETRNRRGLVGARRRALTERRWASDLYDGIDQWPSSGGAMHPALVRGIIAGSVKG